MTGHDTIQTQILYGAINVGIRLSGRAPSVRWLFSSHNTTPLTPCRWPDVWCVVFVFHAWNIELPCHRFTLTISSVDRQSSQHTFPWQQPSVRWLRQAEERIAEADSELKAEATIIVIVSEVDWIESRIGVICAPFSYVHFAVLSYWTRSSLLTWHRWLILL